MKKIFKLLFGIMLFITFIRVNASMLSVDEFINGFTNTDLYKLFTQSDEEGNGNSITVSKDETNHKIYIVVNNENLLSFDYTDEYILYSDPDTVITEELVNEPTHLFSSIMVINAMYTVLDITNHLDKDLDLPEEFSSDEVFNEYGFAYLEEEYSYSHETEDGGTSTSSGDYIRKLQISLDSEKIDHLVQTYGVSRDENVTVPDGLKPTIVVNDIEETKAYIHFELETNDDVEYYCQAYRSTSENGEYVLAGDGIMIPCKYDGVSYADEDLEPNTTYYYKAKIVGGDTFSEIVSIKTKASKVNVDNPKTGNVSPVIFVSVLLVVSIIGLVIVSKNIHSSVL